MLLYNWRKFRVTSIVYDYAQAIVFWGSEESDIECFCYWKWSIVIDREFAQPWAIIGKYRELRSSSINIGKIAQIVDTSHRDWWLVIDFFFIMLVQFLSEIFLNLK